MFKFWKWIYKLSKKKIKQHHIRSVSSDIKCPNCNEWFSISGIQHKHENLSLPDFGYHLKCGQCGRDSYWNAIAAPVLLRCDSKGVPF